MTERVIGRDPSVTTWGVAIPRIGGFIVRAYWSQEDALIDAGLAGKVTTLYVHHETGEAKVGTVFPLVYHHPDGRWVFAATGWDVPLTPRSSEEKHQWPASCTSRSE